MNNLVSNLNMEAINRSGYTRKIFLEKINVLYLTVDRMKPKKSNIYKEEDFYYCGHRSNNNSNN